MSIYATSGAMPETFDLLIRNGTVVNHDGIGARDIGIRAGRIAALGDLSAASAGETIDATGLTILPGVIDTQVHFREPGAEHKEDLETGSRAAVMGGVTAVFEMPNTNPLTVSAAALADKLKRAQRPHALRPRVLGRRHGGESRRYPRAREPARCGRHQSVHGFLDRLAARPERRRHSRHPQETRRRAAFHAEDEFLLADRFRMRRENDPSSHPVWRDADVALSATRRLVAIARETGAVIHVLHVSTADEMRFLADHKDIASVEVTPHHLTFSADDYLRLGTLIQMNPPVRDAGASRRHLGGRRRRHRGHSGLRPRAAHAGGKGALLSAVALRHARRADAGAGHARSCRQGPPVAAPLHGHDQRRSGAPLRHRRQGPHRRRLRRRFHRRRPETAGRRSPTTGSPRAAAGRLTPGCRSPAGRSARSSAARASCGRASSFQPATAGRSASTRRLVTKPDANYAPLRRRLLEKHQPPRRPERC